jgi:hypothetical protein
MRPTNVPRVLVAATAALLLGCGAYTTAVLGAESRERELEQSLLKRVVAQTTRTGLSIRATRDLRAGTLSGKHEGWMRIDTTLTPSGRFEWTIVDEGGSDRTRDKVFRAVLETEQASWRDGDRDAAALTPANYTFAPVGTQNGAVKIRLIPKRADKRLINGILTVSQDGYPLRLEGQLAKSPSFWVKSVHVVKEYGRFAGVALPTTMETTADLKLFGKSRFTMRYEYREVNGRRFAGNALADLTP